LNSTKYLSLRLMPGYFGGKMGMWSLFWIIWGGNCFLRGGKKKLYSDFIRFSSIIFGIAVKRIAYWIGIWQRWKGKGIKIWKVAFLLGNKCVRSELKIWEDASGCIWSRKPLRGFEDINAFLIDRIRSDIFRISLQQVRYKNRSSAL